MHAQYMFSFQIFVLSKKHGQVDHRIVEELYGFIVLKVQEPHTNFEDYTVSSVTPHQ